MDYSKCPSCGGRRFEVAESKWFEDGDHVMLMVCPDCRAEWLFCEMDGTRWIDGDDDYEEVA